MIWIVAGIVFAAAAGFVGCCLGTARAIDLGRRGKIGDGGRLTLRDVLTISAEPPGNADKANRAAARDALIRAVDQSNKSIAMIAKRLAEAAKEAQGKMVVELEAIAAAGVEGVKGANEAIEAIAELGRSVSIAGAKAWPPKAQQEVDVRGGGFIVPNWRRPVETPWFNSGEPRDWSYYPRLGIVEGKPAWIQRTGGGPWVNYQTGEKIQGGVEGWIDIEPMFCDSNAAAEYGRFSDSESAVELRKQLDDIKADRSDAIRMLNAYRSSLQCPALSTAIESKNFVPVYHGSGKEEDSIGILWPPDSMRKLPQKSWEAPGEINAVLGPDGLEWFEITPKRSNPTNVREPREGGRYSSEEDRFTPGIVKALLGGDYPNESGFDFEAVEHWTLREGLLHPYANGNYMDGPKLLIAPAYGYQLPSGANAAIATPAMTAEQVRYAATAVGKMASMSSRDCDCYNDGGYLIECEACEATAAIELIEKMMCPRMETMHPERARSLPERVYLEKWREECKGRSGINGGWGALELIINPEGENGRIPNGGVWVQPRDAMVATTVIQWLATNGGRSFIRTCETELAKREGYQRQAGIDRGVFREVEPDMKKLIADIAAKWISEEKQPRHFSGLKNDILAIVRHFQNNGGTAWKRLEQLTKSVRGKNRILGIMEAGGTYSIVSIPMGIVNGHDWAGPSLGEAVLATIYKPATWEGERIKRTCPEDFWQNHEVVFRRDDVVQDCGDGYAVKGNRHVWVGKDRLAKWSEV